MLYPHIIMYSLTGAAAYDRAITLFSPEGKLYQVEYATKAADMGTLGVGIVYKEGVLLAADRRKVSRLVVTSSEKIFQVDEHIAILSSGIVGDARALVDHAREFVERYRTLYDKPPTTELVAKEIARIKQIYTQYGGIRPFGVVFLIAGFDKRPRLFETVPSGAMTEYKADATGYGKKAVMEFFEKEYRDDMTLEEAKELAIRAIRVGVGEEVDEKSIQMVYIDTDRIVKRVT